MLRLDIKAQCELRDLMRRAAERLVPRTAVEAWIRQKQRGRSVPLDATRCVMIPEDYLVSLQIEDAPGWGWVRHLSVSRASRVARCHPAQVAMVMREVGMTCGIAEHAAWFEPVAGRGQAVHVLEPLTPLNSAGLPAALRAAALAEDEPLAPAPDELAEEEAA